MFTYEEVFHHQPHCPAEVPEGKTTLEAEAKDKQDKNDDNYDGGVDGEW